MRRIFHGVARHLRRRSWFYVDDLLRSSYMKTSLTGYASSSHSRHASVRPSAGKKAHSGDTVAWCGWSFDFSQQTIHLAQSKRCKLREQLQQLLRSKEFLQQIGGRARTAHGGHLRMPAPPPIPRVAVPLFAQRGRNTQVDPPAVLTTALRLIGRICQDRCAAPWPLAQSHLCRQCKDHLQGRPAQSTRSTQRYMDARGRSTPNRSALDRRKQVSSALATAVLCARPLAAFAASAAPHLLCRCRRSGGRKTSRNRGLDSHSVAVCVVLRGLDR